MKTFYRCTECERYTLQSESCPVCGSEVKFPYPARFSLVKEKKFRHLIRKADHDLE